MREIPADLSTALIATRMKQSDRIEIELMIREALDAAANEAIATHDSACTPASMLAQCRTAYAFGYKAGADEVTERISQTGYAFASSIARLGRAPSDAAEKVFMASVNRSGSAALYEGIESAKVAIDNAEHHE